MPRHLLQIVFLGLCPIFVGQQPASSPAVVPAVPSPSPNANPSAETFSIQYIPSDERLIYKPSLGSGHKKTIETFDQISQSLAQGVTQMLNLRGFHLVSQSEDADRKVTIRLRKASNQATNSLVNPFKGVGVTIRVEVSVANFSGDLLFEKELTGEGFIEPTGIPQSQRAATLAVGAIDDLLRKLDDQGAFISALSSASSGGNVHVQAIAAGSTSVPQSQAELPPVAVPRSAQPTPIDAPVAVRSSLLLLPAGTPIIVAFGETVESKKGRNGDPVSLVLAEDVRVGNDVVARAGTKVTGNFYEAEMPRWARGLAGGGAGVVHIRVSSMALGGRMVRFREGKGPPKQPMPGAELVGKEHLELGGWRIDAGTKARVFTSEDVSLPPLTTER